jgi:hypothetical protein
MLDRERTTSNAKYIFLGAVTGLAIIAFVLLGRWAKNQPVYRPPQEKSIRITKISSSDKHEIINSTATQSAPNENANKAKPEKEKLQNNTVSSSEKETSALSLAQKLNIIKKYSLSSTELESLSGGYESYKSWYEFAGVEKEKAVSGLSAAVTVYRITYLEKNNIGSSLAAEFFIRIYLFSGKAELDIAKSYFISAISEYGITPDVREYLKQRLDGYNKQRLDGYNFDYSFFYSDKENVIVEIATVGYNNTFGRTMSKYIERLELKWLNPYPDANLSDPVEVVRFAVNAAIRKDISSIRKLVVPDTILKEIIVAGARSQGKEPTQDYIEVRMTLLSLFVDNFMKATADSGKKNFSFINLGIGDYLQPSFLAVLQEVVGPNNIANILVLNDDKPWKCILLLRANDKWGVLDFTDVPEDIEQILKNL